MKNGRPRPTLPIGAAIYASAHKAVQPPDDRTYSAEVTVFQRNLPHHRSARAVFPRTRSNIIPLRKGIVKQNFRENHKVCSAFSYNLRPQGGRLMRYGRWRSSPRHWACSVSLPRNHRQAGRQGRRLIRYGRRRQSLRHWACLVCMYAANQVPLHRAAQESGSHFGSRMLFLVTRRGSLPL